MTTIKDIGFSAFTAVMKAFNAPFLTIFAACIPYMSVETAVQTAETACDAVDAEWAESDYSLVNRPDCIVKTDKGWHIVWTSRQGNEYVFGVHEDEYFVSYSETGSMGAFIQFIVYGRKIPTDKFIDYPYLGNPMLAQPSTEELQEAIMEAPVRKTATKTKRRGN